MAFVLIVYPSCMAKYLLSALLLLSGCGDLMSVHPLATPATVVFDAGLIGQWACSNKECDGTALIRTASEPKDSYDIVWIPREADEEPVRLTGQLVKVGERVVFDLVAVKREALVIPGHFFMLVEKTSAGVTFHWLDSGWLRDQLIGPKSPAHVMARGKPVLTADSARINAFLAEFGLDPKAVSASMIFKRISRN